MAGKLGRKPPVNKPAIPLSDILSGATPEHPPSADYLAVGDWQMLGNDSHGDCVAVTWANERRLMTRQAGAEAYPDQDQVFEFYKTQNPNFPDEDNGMVIQLALEQLTKTGGPDGVKSLAFAKVNHEALDEVKAALAVFGCLWIGIDVRQANMDQFDHGAPWDYVRGSHDLGGHSVIGGGYDSDMTGGDVKFVTWATETSFTDQYWDRMVEEAWVVVWPEHLDSAPFLEGIDQQRLADAYEAITGRAFPSTTPPAPVPAPAPTDVDARLAEAAKAWLAEHGY